MTPEPMLGSVLESTSLCLGIEGHAARFHHSVTAVPVLEIPFAPDNTYEIEKMRGRGRERQKEKSREMSMRERRLQTVVVFACV